MQADPERHREARDQHQRQLAGHRRAITEPDASSNSHNISTEANRDGAGYVLRGTEYYISGAAEADAILVVARTGRSPSGRGQLSLMVVPANAAGLERTMIPVEVTAPESQFTLFFDLEITSCQE